jgi:benzodiazapine receptor
LKTLTVIVFLALVIGGGSTAGLVTQPGDWYSSLAKPAFNPPSWVFGPVWTFLYLLIALAGARVWQSDRNSLAMRLWGSQLALNFLWSPIFFVAHRIDLALVVVVLLLGTIIAFIVSTYGKDKVSAYLFLPYLAWVSFATLLNASLLVLN